MGARKFHVGEKVRIGPMRLARYYPAWLRVGRVVTIAAIEGSGHNKHAWYFIQGNHRREDGRLRFRCDDLRKLSEPSTRGKTLTPLGERPAKRQGVLGGQMARVEGTGGTMADDAVDTWQEPPTRHLMEQHRPEYITVTVDRGQGRLQHLARPNATPFRRNFTDKAGKRHRLIVPGHTLCDTPIHSTYRRRDSPATCRQCLRKAGYAD